MAPPLNASAREDEKAVPPCVVAAEHVCLKRRPLLFATIAFASGIVAARYLELDAPAALAAAAGFIVLLVAVRRFAGEIVRTALVFALVYAAGAGDYACRGPARTAEDADVAQLLGPTPVLCWITGTVSGEVTVATSSPLLDSGDFSSQDTWLLRIEAETVESNGRVSEVSGAAALVVRLPPRDRKRDGTREEPGPKPREFAPEPSHGDRIRALGWITRYRSRRHTSPVEPAFRFSVAGPETVTIERRGRGSFLRFIYSVKRGLREQIDEYSEALTRFSLEAPFLLKAMLLGDREQLEPRLQSAFNKSGTTHLLAISGLHVGIVYAALFLTCRLLLVRPWARRGIILAVVFSYALITGFRPPTIRAALMISLFEFADALRFYREPVNAVAASALVILIAAPYHLFEAGFQLTFVAVLGIIVFSRDIVGLTLRKPDELERLAEAYSPSTMRRLARSAWKACAVSLGTCAAATMSVAPLQAYYFNIITPVSIVATALLVPVITVFITLGFVFLALAPFVPFLAGLAAAGASLASWLFRYIVETASIVPGGHAFVAAPHAAWVWVFYGALLAVAARRRLRLSGAAAAAIPVLVWCAYAGWRATVAPGPEFAASFLDVGHGSCTVLTRGRETVVYDCGAGGPMSTYDVGEEIAAPHLLQMGVGHIDLLILSHTDMDHVNGVLSLLDKFKVGAVIVHESFGRDPTGEYLNREFRNRSVPVETVSAGDRVELQGFEIEFLWPPRSPQPWRLGAVNNRSLVARAGSGGRTLLLTGDIESAGISGLMATRKDLSAEVLYVSHHGAYDPVLEKLVHAVKPALAVVSDGPKEPAERAGVRRLFTNAQLHSTSERGTVRLISGRDGWIVEAAK